MPARQNLYGGLYGWGPAAGVEGIDRIGERVSSWLTPTRDPRGPRRGARTPRDHAAHPDRQVTTHATADGSLWFIEQRGPDATPGEPVRADVPTLRRLAAELLDTGTGG